MKNFASFATVKPLSEYTRPCDYFRSVTLGGYRQTHTQYMITNSGNIFFISDLYKDRKYEYLNESENTFRAGIDILTAHPERGTMLGIIVVEQTKNDIDTSLPESIEVTIYIPLDTDYKG